MNEQTGKDFDIVNNISHQLPFFCCPNIILSKEFQKDISKYLYCEKFNTPPYNGSFEDQPSRWITKCNIISNSMRKREKMEYDKVKKSVNKEVKNG